MENWIIIIVISTVLLVVLLLTIYSLLKKKPARTLEERMDEMLARIANGVHAKIKDNTIELERNGLKMKYVFNVSKGGEVNAIHHSFSTETRNELKQYYIMQPALPKRQIEIYPKIEFSAYIPSKIKRLLEADMDVDYFINNEHGIFVSIGGNCINAQLGLFMGRKDIIILDAFAELSKGSRFYSLLSGKLTEDEGMEFTNDWEELVARGFNILEKTAKITREK